MKRLLRDFKSQKGWMIAIVILIALSLGIYSSFRSTYDSGIASLDNADKELNSADIIVSVMPMNDLSPDIRNLSGISMVSSAFVSECYTFVNEKMIRGEVSYVGLGERVNDYYILKGKDLESKNDVVVEHHYADKHNIEIGQEIILYINGNAVNFKVCGICFSPNYIYLISPEGGIESDFGVFFIPKVSKSVNAFYVIVSDKNKIDEVTPELKSFFLSKGIDAVVEPADKTFSHTAFREDLGAMNSLAALFTPLLLAISAFLLFVVLSRLIERKRHEIGTLRAMGFSKWSIFSYYLTFSGFAVILGIILAIPISYWLLSFITNYWGVNVLGIPSQFLTYKLNFTHVVYSAIFAVIFSILGAFFPSYRASSFAPAEAMRAYIASGKGARIMSKSPISPTKKLILRDMVGHRARSISTIVVIALLLSLGLSFALSMSSIEEGVKKRFNENERWDIRVSFNIPQNISALSILKSIPGVEGVEPYTGCDAEIFYKNKSVIIRLHELSYGTKMHNFSLSGSGNTGIIISGDVAYRLGVSIGGKVMLYTPFGVNETKISGIPQEFGTSEGYVFKNFTNSTGALLKVRNGEVDKVEKFLQDVPFIKSWVRKDELRDGWLYLMNEYYGMVYAWDMVIAILVIITIGVFAFISIMEREWDFVILKSMGFSNLDILHSGIWGTVLLSFIGSLFAIPLGMHLATLFNASFENILSPPPTILDANIIILRSMLVIGASSFTVFFVMISTLKRNIAERLRRVFETM